MLSHRKTLKKAHELLSVPGVHIRGDSIKEDGLDLAGAIFKATTLVEGSPSGGTAITAVYNVLRKYGFKGSIFEFNDNYKLEDILKVLELAQGEDNDGKQNIVAG